MLCGGAPQREEGVTWLVLRAHGRRTADFIVFSAYGRCSLHVRNREPSQATPRRKYRASLEGPSLGGAHSMGVVKSGRVSFQKKGKNKFCRWWG